MKLVILAALVACAAAQANTRIVGGSDANIANHPWQGALTYSGSFTCGCVLISPTWVLTAAHCVDGREVPSSFTTRFGSSQHASGGTLKQVSSITKHGSYVGSSNTFADDIAVLNLLTPATGINVLPIKMDNRPSSYIHSGCKISGWGRTCGSCSVSSTLQDASTDCISRSQCSSYTSGIGDYHQCVYNGVTGGCNGDSGGPLSCQDGGNVVVGLASFVFGSCLTSYPTVYCRVSYYCSWIQQQTGISCG